MSALFARAADFAARAHAGQHRKGQAQTPYINHPLAVAALVASVTEDPEVLAAAVLHDVMEDAGVTVAELAAAFGEPVAAITAELTDAPDWAALPLSARKARQAENFRTASAAARAIKIADQTANLTDLAAEPGVWTADRLSDYLAGARAIVAVCRDAAPSLGRDFDAAAARLEAAIREGAT